MNENNVQVNGEAVITTAKVDNLFKSFVKIPLLKKIEFPIGNRVSFFNKNEDYIGGMGLFPKEYAEAIVQDNEKVYLISSFHKETQGDYASYGYNLCSGLLTSKRGKTLVSYQKPIEIFSESTACSPGKKIFGPVFDGKTHLPTMVCNGLGNPFGYKGHLWNPYDLVTAIDLNSQKQTEIIKNAKDMEGSNINGKNLISVLVPASKVPSLIKEKSSNELENVFNEKDLNLVERLNKARDLDHMCYGTHSCIERSSFENTSTKGYPRYRLWLNSKGKVYEAKRVFNKDEFLKTLEERG